MKNLFLLLFLSSSMAAPWQLKKEQAGIKVYTRSVAGSNLDEFKGVATLPVSQEAIVAALKDVASLSKWLPDNKVARVLKQSPNHIYYYSVTDAPFPVDDRDAILHFHFRPEGKNMRVSIEGLPDYLPEEENRVRIPSLKGFWYLEPKGAEQTQVTYQVLANPGGSIPAWLANATAVDQPFETLANLRDYLSK
mgnify:CR=1 FL=1